MDQEKQKNIAAELEAMLFVYGEPLAEKKIAALLEVSAEDISAAADELEKLLEGRGLTLTRHDGKLQLVSAPRFGTLVEGLIKQEFQEELTPAAQETLAIIAYAGPIIRADVEFIRGVNSSFILRGLTLRGLVDRDTDPRRANAYIYKVSFDAMRHLGIGKVEELPEYQKYRDLAERFRKQA